MDDVVVAYDGHNIEGARNMAKKKARASDSSGKPASYPRHSLLSSLRIPKAILEQNAGRDCTDEQAAKYMGGTLHGPMRSEIGSSIKFGFLERPAPGRVKPTDLAKMVVRPQNAKDKTESLRKAILKAPQISEVYQHYRGENLPDAEFYDNALADTFHIPRANIPEFKTIFEKSLREANLIEEREGRLRLLDISQSPEFQGQAGQALRKLERSVTVTEGASCFVMMPFAPPHGGYFDSIYEPAIRKAGLRPSRADDEIFATGKVMDQIFRGISDATVLVAELTTRNANVLYELGIAHTLKKPVVLVASNVNDIPFDLRHIRVVLYDVNDPKWGDKLIDKVAEHILSAIKNPEEAIFKSGV